MSYQKKLAHSYKNIFLDRDGVVNEMIMRGNVVSSPRSVNEFVFKRDFLDFSKGLGDRSNLFIVTNQPDIKRGLLKEQDLSDIHEIINRRYSIKKILFCPHDDDDKCLCRKPLPGMIDQVIKEYGLIRNECFLVGDSHKDMLAARAAKIEAALLRTNYNTPLNGFLSIDSLVDLL